MFPAQQDFVSRSSRSIIRAIAMALLSVLITPANTVAQDVRPELHLSGQAIGVSRISMRDSPTLRGGANVPLYDDTAPFRRQHSRLEFTEVVAGTRAVDPDTLRRDPASSSLLLTPTGRTLSSGSGAIGLAAPYIPYAAFAVLPGVQLSAGGVYIFKDETGTGQAYYSYLILKNTLYDDGSSSIAVGAAIMFWGQAYMLGSTPMWDRATIPGVFAVTTFGGEDGALSLGIGFADIAGGFGIGFDAGVLAGLGLGYETRISSNWKLLTEHFSSVLSSGTLHTFGVRHFTGRAAFDLGLIIIPNADITISGNKIPLVLPLLGVSIHIG